MDLTATPACVEHYASRDDWGGGPVRSGHSAPLEQFVGMVLHHTVFVLTDYDRDGFLRGDVDDVCRYMRVLQTARPDLGSEVPYSWVIFPGSSDATCIIAEGRGAGRTGAHTAGLNSSRYAWAIAGNTDADMPITPGMVAGMRWLAAQVLTDPEHAVPTIGHQQAPPYIQNGQNLNATGCPGHNGLEHLAELQPPFTATAPTAAPSRRDRPMYQFVNLTGGAEEIALYTDGTIRNSWQTSPDGQMAPYAQTVPGVFEALGKPVIVGEAPNRQVWVPAVGAAAYGSVRFTLIYPGHGEWQLHETENLRRFLAGQTKKG
ncbi:MAG TPA: hypothetical protein VGE43_19495 [Acidimicrobiales bacterium]